MAFGSGYQQLPRYSAESDQESNDLLIPSPDDDGIIDVSSPKKPWSLSVKATTLLRIFAASCGIAGFVVTLVCQPYGFLPSAIFMLFAVVHNIFMLIARAASCPVSLSLDYEGRDILKSRKCSFKKPRLSGCVDVALSVALFICLTIALVEYGHGNWYSGNPVASGVLGYVLLTTQAIIAIPRVGGVSLVLRRDAKPGAKPDPQSRQTSLSANQLAKKISMVGAVHRAEETAPPADLV